MPDEEAKPPPPPEASPKARGPALARMGSAYTKAGSKLLLSPQENKAGASRMRARSTPRWRNDSAPKSSVQASPKAVEGTRGQNWKRRKNLVCAIPL